MTTEAKVKRKRIGGKRKMFKKKKVIEQVEADTSDSGNDAILPPPPPKGHQDDARTQETRQISKINLEALQMLSEAINEKYAFYLTPEEASQLPAYVFESLKLSLALAQYDELRKIRAELEQIRALNEE